MGHGTVEDVAVDEAWDVTPATMAGEKKKAWLVELHQTIEVTKYCYDTQLTDRYVVDDEDKMKSRAKYFFDQIGLSQDEAFDRKELERLDEWDGENCFTLSGGDCPDTGAETMVEIKVVALEAKVKWVY